MILKRIYAILFVVVLVVGLPILTVAIENAPKGKGNYAVQSHVLMIWQVATLVLWVSCADYLLSLISGDDLESDYQRIDSGNVAVATYRGAERGCLILAGALLIFKI